MKAKKGIAFGALHAPLMLHALARGTPRHATPHQATHHQLRAPFVVLHPLITLRHTRSPGELALLHNAPRAATVTAETHVRPMPPPTPPRSTPASRAALPALMGRGGPRCSCSAHAGRAPHPRCPPPTLPPPTHAAPHHAAPTPALG